MSATDPSAVGYRAAILDALAISGRGTDAEAKAAAQMHGLIAEARVFAVRAADLRRIAADLYAYLDGRDRAALLQRMEVPAPRPFPAMWIGLETPYPIPRVRMPEYNIPPHWYAAEVYGWYLGDGLIMRFALAEAQGGRYAAGPHGERETWYTRSVFERRDGVGGWLEPYSVDPWLLHTLVHVINECGTTLIETPRDAPRKRRRRRKAERSGPPLHRPGEYHVVDLADRLVWAAAARKVVETEAPAAWTLQHRVDVRGHWWCRVRRGPLPLVDRERERLEGRGYVVADDDADLPDTHDAAIRKRAIPRRRPGEWMAVLLRWVDAHQRGPDGGPVVPATWRVRVPEEGLV